MDAALLKVRVTADTNDAERGLRTFGSALSNTARTFGTTGALMTAGVTAPLVALGVKALDSAADFEQSMNILRQVTRAPIAAMDELQATALRLGAETSFSAGEAAAAMLELGRAGMSTQDIMASIGGVLDLAAAGGVGLSRAAEVTAAALNAFSLNASESGAVANMFAAAANASAASVDDLASGVQQSGFAFAAAGQQLDDLLAALAILTNVGLTGSDAGTALKNMMLRLINPTKEAASLMAELGINAYDAQGNMLPLVEVIGEFASATEGMTQEQRNAALSTILMSDGMKAMIPLLDAGTVGFSNMKTEVNAQGAAAETAAARMQGLSGAMEYLQGSIDSFLIGGAQPFLNTIGSLVRSAADMITQFGQLPDPVKNAALAFATVVAAAGPLLGIVAGISGALMLLGGAGGPILLVVGALASLAAAWAANLGGMQERTQAWANSISPAFQQVADLISTIAKGGDINAMLTAELKIDWSQVDVNAAGLIDAVSKELQRQDWMDEGRRAGAVIVEPFKTGIFAGFAAAVASEDWTPERPLWDVALGNLNRVFWEQIGEFGRGVFQGIGIDVRQPDPMSDAAKTFMKDGNILLAAIAEWGTKIGAEMTTLGTEFDRITTTMDAAAQAVADAISSFIQTITDRVNAVLERFGISIGEEAAGALGARGLGLTLSDTLRTQQAVAAEIASMPPVQIPATPHFSPESVQAFIDAIGVLEVPVKPVQGPPPNPVDLPKFPLPKLQWPTMEEMMRQIQKSAPTAMGGGMDIPLKAMITEVEPAATLAPLQIKAIVTDLAESFNPAGEILNQGAAALSTSLSGFTWPALPTWTWPEFPVFSWPALPQWTWPPIPRPGWLDQLVVPRPTWLGQLLTWSPTVVLAQQAVTAPGQLASGTTHWRGGMTWVGERGPELVDLPRGSRVYSNQESRAIAANAQQPVNITINANVNGQQDWQRVAYEVARILGQRG